MNRAPRTVPGVAAAAVLLAVIATATDSPSARAAPVDVDGITLELVGQQYAFDANGTFTLDYRVVGGLAALEQIAPMPPPAAESTPPDPPAGPTTTAPSEPVAEVDPLAAFAVRVSNYAPLTTSTSAERLDEIIGSDVARTSFGIALDGVEFTGITDALTVDDGDVTLRVTVVTDAGDSEPDRLKFDTPGLYPLRVDLVVDQSPESDSPDDIAFVATNGTVVERLPATTDSASRNAPVEIALVSNIAAPGPNATDRELAAARLAFDELAEVTGVIDAPFALTVPPPVVADAADSSAAAPDELGEAFADDQFLAQPLVPLDVSSIVAVNRSDAFARLLREGEDVVTESLPTVISGRDVWVADVALSAAGAQELRDLGFRYVAMPTAVYQASVSDVLPEPDLFVQIVLPDGGLLPLLVIDPGGEALTADGTREVLGTMSATDWAVRYVTDLLLDDLGSAGAADQLDRSRIVATPDLSTPDPRLLIALEQLVASTPSVVFEPAEALTGVTDTQLVDGKPVEVELPPTAGPSLTERVKRLDGAALTAASVASMLPGDDPRLAEWTAQLDSLISTGFTDEDVEAALAPLDDEADRLRNSVVPPDPFTFTLTGRSGDIDVRIENTSDEELTVAMSLSSPKLEFPGGDEIVVLRPNSVTTVTVPVEARANGTSAVTVDLATPFGEPLGEPVTLTSRVNSLTGFGQVLTGGLIVVLLTWWISHWRARRRRDAGAEEISPASVSTP